MRIVVVGLGVQGHKRRKFAGADYVCSVDPANREADYRRIEDVPPASYDATLLCVPDQPKISLLRHLLGNGKHVLVEKPLWAAADSDIAALEGLARGRGALCYTAYNHRFEPHYVRMRDLVRSGALGRIYRCRMFYGNGTARLVRESEWRDHGAGVLPDLGSHLLDTAKFWFGDLGEDFQVMSANCHENRAPDHVVIASQSTAPALELEMTLLSWRNHFTCDIFAEKGSAHISSLCKWGPTTFTHRTRVLPSGRPLEDNVTLEQEDPTWALEYAHFRELCESGAKTDLSNDLWLNGLLRALGAAAIAKAGKREVMLTHLHASPKKPARVVVLGVGGFIGGAIRRRLAADGIPVLGLGRPGLDLFTADAAKRLAETLAPEDVLVFASARAPCRDLGMLRENIVMAGAVCAALKERPVAHVVYISSDAVYSDSSQPLTEASCAEPASLHGIMHLAREVALRQEHAGPLALVRPTLVYGLEDPHNGYGPNRFRRLAADGKEIVLFGEGEERRDHVDVEDIAELVRLIVLYRSSGIANAVSGAVVSFRELAEFVASEFMPRVAVKGGPRTMPMPHNGYRPFDNSAVLRAFPGFRFKAAREGLARIHARIKAEGARP